jgi:hypothetical protein
MFLLAWISNSLIQLVFACHQVEELVAFDLCLSVALSFEVVLRTRQRLKGKEPKFTNSVPLGRFMLCWDLKKRSLQLVELDRERAIASLKFGQPVIPIWLDWIHRTIANKLGN